MDNTKEIQIMAMCQQTKDFLKAHQAEYVDFTIKSLNKDEFVKAMDALLPFDNMATARLTFVGKNTQVKCMSISIMKMDMKPATFSLGVGLEIEKGEYNRELAPTVFITAGKTLEELREYVATDEFVCYAIENLNQQIEKCFYPEGD